MSSKRYYFILRKLLQVAFIYMVFEAILHASGIRLWGVENYWPASAVQFAYLFMWLWASLSFFMSAVLYFCLRYLDQAKPLLHFLTFPALVHAVLVFWLSFNSYPEIFPTAGLYAWTEYYAWVLRAECVSLLAGCALIWYGKYKTYL